MKKINQIIVLLGLAAVGLFASSFAKADLLSQADRIIQNSDSADNQEDSRPAKPISEPRISVTTQVTYQSILEAQQNLNPNLKLGHIR